MADTGTWPLPTLRWYHQQQLYDLIQLYHQQRWKSRPLNPIEAIAALINKLAIAPLISIIMPFVAKNRKRMMNRRLRDTSNEEWWVTNNLPIPGWMGTRRTIQQRYMRNRMGAEASGNFYDGRSMLQEILPQLTNSYL